MESLGHVGIWVTLFKPVKFTELSWRGGALFRLLSTVLGVKSTALQMFREHHATELQISRPWLF